jgi:hypothetical protein
LLGYNLVGGGGGGGGGTIPGDTSTLPRSSLGRAQIPATFDPFTYGQNLPGAQSGEFDFFTPASWSERVSGVPGAGEGVVDFGGGEGGTDAAGLEAYNAGVAQFTQYQNALEQAVATGQITPTQATELAIQYAEQLGLTINPSATAMKDGGEVEDDMVKHLMEYRRSGGHQGPGQVKGVGSGQEDLIPAWLSDGEYVWSAQDVADLGDGSTDEGVRRLDKMRQMVRKQAGRKDVKKIAKPQRGIDTMLKAVGGSV